MNQKGERFLNRVPAEGTLRVTVMASTRPTRTVTPRLQAAIERTVQLLDGLCVGYALVDMGEDRELAEAARAELLEAFEEATSERDASLGPARVERLEKRNNEG